MIHPESGHAGAMARHHECDNVQTGMLSAAHTALAHTRESVRANSREDTRLHGRGLSVLERVCAADGESVTGVRMPNTVTVCQ
jgi:hypothetical protein